MSLSLYGVQQPVLLVADTVWHGIPQRPHRRSLCLPWVPDVPQLPSVVLALVVRLWGDPIAAVRLFFGPR